MRIRVIDFETTGTPPDADVVEAAYQDVVISSVEVIKPEMAGWADKFMADQWSRLVKPEQHECTIEARAAHHISDAEIELRGISWDEAQARLVQGTPDFYCAHNAAFEKQFFDFEDARWLCTMKIAYRVFENAPTFSNQGLRYFLRNADPGKSGMPPHRALPDCIVTSRILLHSLIHAPIKLLEQWSDEPAMPPTIRFGKHRGKKWADVDAGYLSWILRSEFDLDTKHCARVELERRTGSTR